MRGNCGFRRHSVPGGRDELVRNLPITAILPLYTIRCGTDERCSPLPFGSLIIKKTLYSICRTRSFAYHRVNPLILKRAISHILPQLPFYLLFSPLPVHFSENKILKSCCSIIACFLGKTESKYSYRFLSNCTLILLSFGFQRLIFPRYFVS